MPHRYAHGCETRPPRENCSAVALRASYHSRVAILPHRWTCGFEDHWTLNLLNTSRLWKHLCTETLCWATMEFSVQSPTTLLISMFSCMLSLLYKKHTFRMQPFPVFVSTNGMEDLHRALFNSPKIKCAHGHADQGTKSQRLRNRDCDYPRSTNGNKKATFGWSKYILEQYSITKQEIWNHPK